MSRERSEAGSAVIEFIVVGVGLLVPAVYVVQCILVAHSAVLASAQATREAARAFSTAGSTVDGQRRAAAAARLAFADQGLDLPENALRISCVDGACLAPGSAIVADIDWRVPLPWLPDSWVADASIPVSSTQRVPIDDFRSNQE